MLSAIRQMAGGNPEAFAQRLMQNNPQFADFVRQNQGKSPQQIAADYGVDYNLISQFL